MRWNPIIIVLMIFCSCSNESSFSDLEHDIASKIILQNNFQDSSLIILGAKQGIFSFWDSPNDTTTILYSGLSIGKVNIPSDSLQVIWSNLYNFEEAPGLFALTNRWNKKSIAGVPVIPVSQFKDYLYKSGETNSHKIDWGKLKKMGIEKICSFSDPMVYEKDKTGYCGFQLYSKNNFQLNVVYFDCSDTVTVFDYKKMDFELLDLICRFSEGGLAELEPSKLILK